MQPRQAWNPHMFVCGSEGMEYHALLLQLFISVFKWVLLSLSPGPYLKSCVTMLYSVSVCLS